MIQKKIKQVNTKTGQVAFYASPTFVQTFKADENGFLELKEENGRVWCQFTGFKDGSQKEIFEGDVLLDEYPRQDKDRLVVVVFESGCFQLHRFPKGQDEILGDYICDMYCPANEGRLLDYKVIGNQWMSQEKLSEEVFYASKSRG